MIQFVFENKTSGLKRMQIEVGSYLKGRNDYSMRDDDEL